MCLPEKSTKQALVIIQMVNHKINYKPDVLTGHIPKQWLKTQKAFIVFVMEFCGVKIMRTVPIMSKFLWLKNSRNLESF